MLARIFTMCMTLSLVASASGAALSVRVLALHTGHVRVGAWKFRLMHERHAVCPQ